jgi:glutamine amidotransferase
VTRLGVIDLGLNNLGSIVGCAKALKTDVFVCSRPEDLPEVDRIIIPGVGSFRFAIDHVRETGWNACLEERVFAAGTPVLGICLGMHLLGQAGVEGGAAEGLGQLAGTVCQLDVGHLPLPHIGWDSVHHSDDPIFDGIPSGADFYFAHSFGYSQTDCGGVIATTTYGVGIPVAMRAGSVVGVQFHPEKSSKWGNQLLRNFLFGEAE